RRVKDPPPHQTKTVPFRILRLRQEDEKKKPASTREPIPQGKKLRVGSAPKVMMMIKSVGPGLGPGQAGQRPASTPDPPPYQTRLHTSFASTQDQTCTLLNTALKSRRRKQKRASTRELIPQSMRLRVGYRREKVMIKSVGPGLGPGQAGQRPASTPDQTCTLLNTALKTRGR